MLSVCHLLVIIVLTSILHAAYHRQAGDDCCKAAPPIMVVHPFVPMEITFMDNGGNIFILYKFIDYMNS
jgi:hypothetical protein